MTNRSTSPLRRPSRRAFTLIELLVVIAILALLASMALVAYGRVGENARIAGTKTLIRQLDSTLQERMESFRRYDFAPLAQAFFRYSGTAEQYQPVSMFKRLTYRAEFPQRLEDLYGFDGDSGDGHAINGSMPPVDARKSRDNSPLWTIIKSRTSVGSADLAVDDGTPGDEYISNGELLYLFLTEASSYGLAPLDISQINPRYVIDKDDDSFPEFVDGWEQPLRFYSAPTALLRPGGNAWDKDGMPPAALAISTRGYRNARNIIRALPSLPLDPMTSQPRDLQCDEYDHPLNIDPFDYVGITTVDADMTLANESLFEARFYSIDTFFVPLSVSAGSDQILGMYEPTMTTFDAGDDHTDNMSRPNGVYRLGMIKLDPASPSGSETPHNGIYDNLTNYQRGGF